MRCIEYQDEERVSDHVKTYVSGRLAGRLEARYARENEKQRLCLAVRRDPDSAVSKNYAFQRSWIERCPVARVVHDLKIKLTSALERVASSHQP